jgi:hypothetical protein
LLDDFLGLVVFAFAKMVVADAPLGIDKIVRRQYSLLKARQIA